MAQARFLRHLLAPLLLLAGILSARATDYYVSPSGLDTQPGTQAAPWLTLQHAADTLTPGDRVLVRSGTYAGVTVNVSGSAAAGPVTFTNYPGEFPVIDAAGVTPPAGHSTLFLIKDHSHVIVSGFELRNYKTIVASRVLAGILITGACSHVEIRNCHVHDIWNTGGTKANPGNAFGNAFGIAVYGTSTTPSDAIVLDGNEIDHLKTGASESVTLNGNVTHIQVTNNLVHDNNNIGIDFIGFEGTCPDPAQDQARDGLCRGNRVWNISSQNNIAYADGDYSAGGIYCDGAARITIEANTVYASDIGVELASEHPNTLTSAIQLRSNFVYANRQTGLFLGGYAASGTGGSTGCVISGNTFHANDTLALGNGEAQLRSRVSNCSFTGNIFSAGPTGALVTVPVAAVHNSQNTFSRNLYFASGNPGSWSWNNTPCASFAAWKSASGQDATSLFTDPHFIVNSATTPDLHLRLDSPAVDFSYPAAATLDIDQGPRPTGAGEDLGADELTPVDSWRHTVLGADATNPAISSLTASPSGDGIPNLLKYALVLDPRTDSTSSLPRGEIQTIDGVAYLAIRFTHSVAAIDAACIVQSTADLVAWQDGSRYGLGESTAPNAATTEISRTRSGDVETILVRDNQPLAAPGRRFLRLQVTLP